MRGNSFHNKLVNDAETVFFEFGWQTDTEQLFTIGGIITYFDLFARDGPLKIACEIETTCRHALDNLRKAQAVGIPLWIIVPTRRIQKQIRRSTGIEPVFSGNRPVMVLLPDELKKCIQNYNNLKGNDYENQMG